MSIIFHYWQVLYLSTERSTNGGARAFMRSLQMSRHTTSLAIQKHRLVIVGGNAWAHWSGMGVGVEHQVLSL